MPDAELRIVVSEAGSSGTPSEPTAEPSAATPAPVAPYDSGSGVGVPGSGSAPSGPTGETIINDTTTVLEGIADAYQESAGTFRKAVGAFQSGVWNFLAVVEAMRAIRTIRGSGGSAPAQPPAPPTGERAAGGAGGFRPPVIIPHTTGPGGVLTGRLPTGAEAVGVGTGAAIRLLGRALFHPATIVIAGMALATAKVVGSLNAFGKSLEEQAEELSRFSVVTSAARQQLEIDRLRREIDRAQAFEGPLARNLALQNQQEQLWRDITDRFADEGLAIRNTIKELENKLLEGANTTLDALAVLQNWVKDNPALADILAPFLGPGGPIYREILRWIDFDRAERRGDGDPLDLFGVFFTAPDPVVTGFNDAPGAKERRPHGRARIPDRENFPFNVLP